MKHNLTIELKFGSQSLGTVQTRLMHSFGFLVLSDSTSIESELQRVKKDIEFIRTVESIGRSALFNVARNSKDEETLIQNLISEYSCSVETARMIAESDVSALSSDSMSTLAHRLLKYMDFLVAYSESESH